MLARSFFCSTSAYSSEGMPFALTVSLSPSGASLDGKQSARVSIFMPEATSTLTLTTAIVSEERQRKLQTSSPLCTTRRQRQA